MMQMVVGPILDAQLGVPASTSMFHSFLSAHDHYALAMVALTLTTTKRRVPPAHWLK